MYARSQVPYACVRSAHLSLLTFEDLLQNTHTRRDLTDFANDHPGGSEYISRNAGVDCTEEFTASHPVDIIERTLEADDFEKTVEQGGMRLGPVDPATMTKADVAAFDAASAHGARLPPRGEPAAAGGRGGRARRADIGLGGGAAGAARGGAAGGRGGGCCA